MARIIETNRLILRNFSEGDASSFYNLNLDKDVMKYTGDIPFATVQEALALIQNYSDYERNGFGRWTVICKTNGATLGWCGLKKHPQGFVDLGYRFHKKFWKKGYATEAAQACLQYGFTKLGLIEIIGRTSKENLASIRVLEKIKMNFWKYDYCEGIPNSAYYKITKEQYLKL